MNRKRAIHISLAIGCVGILAIVVSLSLRNLASRDGPTDASLKLAPLSLGEAYSEMNHSDREKVKSGLKTLVGELSKVGLKPVPKIDGVLAAAVATGDYGQIRRAFSDAIYGRFANMDESVEALKLYINSTDPIISYLAAEHLLIAGDRSGVGKLIEILKSPDAIAYRIVTKDFELRNIICETLGKFRVEEAIPFLMNYYSRTGSGHAVGALTNLRQRAGPWAESYNGAESVGYAFVGATEYLPDIKKTFKESTDAETRIGAAWAAAYMGGGSEYVDHLIEASRLAANAPNNHGGSDFNQSREALRYLGTIQTPEAVSALEEALESRNPRASSVALVNLLFNQKEPSEKARQMLLQQLNGTADHHIFPELAMRAIAVLDDTELRDAAEKASRMSSAYKWNLWGVKRANWPVENWIYDYIVIRNRTE
ncbi:MAG: hypothetical protein QE273_17045 [Verrucomicrobiales bacterium]|nr:hypothetical protein [Verrucomicrobiales bacterium]